MKQKNRLTNIALIAVIITATITGCKKDNSVDPIVIVDPLKTTYQLIAKDLLGVSGTISFAELSTGSSKSIITISLTGAPVSNHPASIRMNSVVETGGLAYTLSDVDTSGKCITVLSVPYSSLVNFDGYVNIVLDILNPGTIIAQGDIGGNALTSSHKIYTLAEDSASGIFGTARFDKRKNGNTLVTIDLNSGGALPAGYYPAHINLGSVATIGLPENRKTLVPVDAATKISLTNIRTLNDGTAINYDNWMVYDGFISIHDAADTTDVIAKGNIGSN